MNKLHLFILIFIALPNVYSDDVIVPNDWKRHEVIVEGFTPFFVYLPSGYGINIDRKQTSGTGAWATHIINYNNRPVGGIFFGNFIPDYVLWGINDEQLNHISIKVFNNLISMKVFEENNTYKFEYCFIDFTNNQDEKYIHLWGGSAFYNGVLGISEETKNVLMKVFSTMEIIN